MGRSDPLIDARSLGFTYEGESAPACADFSGTLRPGEMWHVCGRNGGGKTTALRVVAGLAPRIFRGRISGAARVLGRTLDDTGAIGLAEEVGVVTENPWAQLSGLRRTVEGEISLALESRGWSEHRIKRRVATVMAQMGLEHVRIQSPHHLSGGEHQALVVACAIAHEPPLLILDEPELHLDPDRIGFVRAVIDESLAAGRGVVCASHLPADQLPASAVQWVAERRSRPKPSASRLPLLPAHRSADAPLVELLDVTFGYGDRPILAGLSLRVEAGKVTALTGPNGAGKTTVAKLMLGLLRPHVGEIHVLGRPIAGERASKVSRSVGLVFQNPSTQLFRRSVRAEIEASLASAETDGTPAVVDAIAHALGISEDLDENPYDLPWSRRRLAAVACMVARAPQVLVLDEPTAGLDVEERNRIADIMRQWADAGGGVLTITHDTDWAKGVCDATFDLVAINSGRCSVE